MIGELEYRIEQQDKEIKQLKQRNNKQNVLIKDLRQDNRLYYDTLYEILNNEINIKELQEVYIKVSDVFNNAANGQNVTRELRQIKDKAENDKLFYIASSLFEYKPY